MSVPFVGLAEAYIEVSETAGVDGSHLVDQHQGPDAVHPISGRKIAGCALVDVGATMRVESKITSLWIATAYRGPAARGLLRPWRGAAGTGS